ncbi:MULTISPECIES: methyltransferase domain-containing protein [unclassified Paraburkholderia]|uniref:methyltransferase domain-containing protein n=1 Tax=unclassified Paraburkholderia TaxID=2615204 RepID=UPI000E25E9C6|nr:MULTISPECIES: methyltransferase domain-containing protein [unclassified Paraburkholderia]REE22610.1 O-antigen chain-terminating methyltransferase [Paraburkholderia sp. BL27I4N3]RKR36805.1 O-antigen chain-terminating methyltransferase [Paraburkholderia sp. BL17N1]
MTNAVLQDLIARVKAEAAAHASPDDTGNTLAPDRPVSAFEPVPGAADLAGRNAIEHLLVTDNEEFVDGAYRLLLAREADATGRATYMEQIARGVSRLVVLAKLRMSAEGRRVAVPVSRLSALIAAAAADQLLRRVGLGGLARRAGRTADGLYARYVLRRSLPAWRARFENTVGVVLRQGRQIEQLSQRFVELREDLVPTPAVSPETIDAYYLAFEDANRGTRESVLAKLAIYKDWLATCVPRADGLTHEIVDVGCGRGEWLVYVRQNGRDAIGIDVNRVMVDACLAQGLNVRCTDSLTFLRSLPTGSVAAVTGFHIIEHLPFDYLFALVQESYRVLVEGGSVLFETPNPENVLVGSHTFYHDFTHRNPITPSAISFLLKYHRFEEIDIIRSSPYPEEAKVPGNDPLTERVNGHLCGPQDFAVLGRKRAADGGEA